MKENRLRTVLGSSSWISWIPQNPSHIRRKIMILIENYYDMHQTNPTCIPKHGGVPPEISRATRTIPTPACWCNIAIFQLTDHIQGTSGLQIGGTDGEVIECIMKCSKYPSIIHLQINYTYISAIDGIHICGMIWNWLHTTNMFGEDAILLTRKRCSQSGGPCKSPFPWASHRRSGVSMLETDEKVYILLYHVASLKRWQR